MFPDSKWIHFGDIDPDGIKIALMISKKTGRPLDIYIPTFLEEYFDLGFRTKVQWDGINLSIPPLEKLKESGIGIYQERYMLDKRLYEDIKKACLTK